MLHEFLRTNHETLVKLARERLIERAPEGGSFDDAENGVPLFLRQLERILEREQETVSRPSSIDRSPASDEMAESAGRLGGELRRAGYTVAQVVQGYGDVCQAITALADRMRITITADEFRTLNRCLDEVIAEAVSEFARQRESVFARENSERLGIFAHELRNLLNNAQLSYEVLRTGTVGIASNTGLMLGRSLLDLRRLIDVSLAAVRLEVGNARRDRVALTEFIEEIELAATMGANALGRSFSAGPTVPGIYLHVDRQLLAAAVGNLVQNAIKHSRTGGLVLLRTDTVTQPERVRIEVEDSCGGLPPGFIDTLFQAFHQHGADRTGLGLGLVIARQGVEANGGVLRVRDLPGKGCIFTVDLPKAPEA